MKGTLSGQVYGLFNLSECVFSYMYNKDNEKFQFHRLVLRLRWSNIHIAVGTDIVYFKYLKNGRLHYLIKYYHIVSLGVNYHYRNEDSKLRDVKWFL